MSKERKFPEGTRPVMIEWIDSSSTGGWGNLKEPSNMRCISVGHLVSRSKDRVTLAMSRSPWADGHHLEIPNFAIKRIRKLK